MRNSRGVINESAELLITGAVLTRFSFGRSGFPARLSGQKAWPT